MGTTGSINPAGVQTGVVFDGATGYNWTQAFANGAAGHPLSE